MLYYLHPDVGFFKGNGFKAIGPYLDMPGKQAHSIVPRANRSPHSCRMFTKCGSTCFVFFPLGLCLLPHITIAMTGSIGVPPGESSVFFLPLSSQRLGTLSWSTPSAWRLP